MKKRNPCSAFMVAVAMTVASGAASASWFRNDIGQVIPGDGTHALGSDIQASNTWDDWYWNGKHHNMAYYCNPKLLECTYGLGRTVSTGYSQMHGTAVNGAYGISLGGFTAQYIKSVTKSHQRINTSTDTFHNGVVFRPGYWCNPLKVAVRRWKRGAFNGAWFRTGWISGGANANTVYDWLWKKHGAWTANVAEWHYVTFQISRSI